MIAPIFGAVKAAKTYLSLDPSFPVTRTIQILEDSQASLIVTDSKNLALVGEELAQAGCQVINVDEISSSCSADNPGLSVSPDSFAHLLYTLCSMRRPKSVLQAHRNGMHLVATYTNSLHVCAQDRVALLYSHSVINMGNAVIIPHYSMGWLSVFSMSNQKGYPICRIG